MHLPNDEFSGSTQAQHEYKEWAGASYSQPVLFIDEHFGARRDTDTANPQAVHGGGGTACSSPVCGPLDAHTATVVCIDSICNAAANATSIAPISDIKTLAYRISRYAMCACTWRAAEYQVEPPGGPTCGQTKLRSILPIVRKTERSSCCLVERLRPLPRALAGFASSQCGPPAGSAGLQPHSGDTYAALLRCGSQTGCLVHRSHRLRVIGEPTAARPASSRRWYARARRVPFYHRGPCGQACPPGPDRVSYPCRGGRTLFEPTFYWAIPTNLSLVWWPFPPIPHPDALPGVVKRCLKPAPAGFQAGGGGCSLQPSTPANSSPQPPGWGPPGLLATRQHPTPLVKLTDSAQRRRQWRQPTQPNSQQS